MTASTPSAISLGSMSALSSSNNSIVRGSGVLTCTVNLEFIGRLLEKTKQPSGAANQCNVSLEQPNSHRGLVMAQTSPWHSTAPNDPKVHHDNTDCREGDNIQPENRKSGTGGHPKCKHCAQLDGDLKL